MEERRKQKHETRLRFQRLMAPHLAGLLPAATNCTNRIQRLRDAHAISIGSQIMRHTKAFQGVWGISIITFYQ
jgi:hypothetical protein